jgi:hypothetical protein
MGRRARQPRPNNLSGDLEANYAWQGDVFDDDRPYLQIFEGLALGADRIVAIPLTMEINDLPHAMRFGRSPVQYVELFDEALARMCEDDGEAVMLDVTAPCPCLRAADGRLGVRGNRRQGRRLRRCLACDQGRDRGPCAADPAHATN